MDAANTYARKTYGLYMISKFSHILLPMRSTNFLNFT